YTDESALIPKSTSVMVRRVPYKGPKMSQGGKGQQQQPQQFGQQQHHVGNRSSGYGGGGGGGGGGQGYGGSFHRGHHGNSPSTTTSQYGYRGPQGIGLNNSYSSSQNNNNSGVGSGVGDLNGQHELERNPDVISDAEEARIAAMLQQTDEQWSHQQTIMQMQRPVFNNRGGAYRPRPRIERPEHQGPPPPNYVCHRCGIAGHWIHNCPTIGQPSDGNSRNTGHRIKRTTGIPKSFLQKVDKLEEGGNALVTSDGTL
ncbi:Retinoblastoma-binding protein, partial [Linderina pennispora]